MRTGTAGRESRSGRTARTYTNGPIGCTAAPCRSARPMGIAVRVDERHHHVARRSNSARAKNAAAFFDDLVGAPQLTVLALKLLETPPLLGRQAFPCALVTVGLAHPLPERHR